MARQRQEREEREEREREEAEERKRLNAEARQRYIDGLAAKKAEERRRHEAETDARLAPAKARARRDWLIAHPGKEAADFDREAWPLVRENLIEDEAAARVEATKAALRASGQYNL